MKLEDLQDKYELIDIFVKLAKIPSPPMGEEKVAFEILKFFKENNISAFQDAFGNVIARILPSDNSKNPLLLSAHMDVVGDDSPVNVVLNGKFIETDKTRTLGADNKAGVAAAMLLVKEITNDKTIKHGGIELVFTRDEECSMSGIRNVDMSSLESEYVLVLDADKLGQVLISGAGFTKLTINIETAHGGHSGIDIADGTRLNAVKLVGEVIDKIPQGIYKQGEYGVITSINAGAVIGGGIESGITKVCGENVKCSDYKDIILKHSMTNIINTKASVIYSIRSSDINYENELIADVEKIIINFNEKYVDLAHAELQIETHLPSFEKSPDETIIKAAKKAAAITNTSIDIASFHAGAETHIYANEYNKPGNTFKPVLAGIADIYNMHSNTEKIDYYSFVKGYEFLKQFFISYNF